MTRLLPSLTLAGAEFLRSDRFSSDDVAVIDGKIREISIPSETTMLDLTGCLVLPGIIDLPGDAFEHHIAPRPIAPFLISVGLAGTDRDATASGVTTAWMAQSWSWDGGHRSPDFEKNYLWAHEDFRPRMLTDLHVQIRCETHTMDTQDQLIDAIWCRLCDV